MSKHEIAFVVLLLGSALSFAGAMASLCHQADAQAAAFIARKH